ncbi:hypothetical protein LY78DRAFT_131478 [Colletotrichum sublineola]|nr:hypothetical protein LY78DRAFT_131478 [Colletotrichum sublineola]
MFSPGDWSVKSVRLEVSSASSTRGRFLLLPHHPHHTTHTHVSFFGCPSHSAWPDLLPFSFISFFATTLIALSDEPCIVMVDGGSHDLHIRPHKTLCRATVRSSRVMHSRSATFVLLAHDICASATFYPPPPPFFLFSSFRPRPVSCTCVITFN